MRSDCYLIQAKLLMHFMTRPQTGLNDWVLRITGLVALVDTNDNCSTKCIAQKPETQVLETSMETEWWPRHQQRLG